MEISNKKNLFAEISLEISNETSREMLEKNLKWSQKCPENGLKINPICSKILAKVFQKVQKDQLFFSEFLIFRTFGNFQKLPEKKTPEIFRISRSFRNLLAFPNGAAGPKDQGQPLAAFFFFLQGRAFPWHFCYKGNPDPVSVAADKVASGSPPRPYFT